MKITGFSPLIMTNDAENAGKVFEALGFTKKHEKKDASENHDSGFRMKDADGHGISIAIRAICRRSSCPSKALMGEGRSLILDMGGTRRRPYSGNATASRYNFLRMLMNDARLCLASVLCVQRTHLKCSSQSKGIHAN